MHRHHIPGSFLAVNKVDGALVEATTFLVCSEKRVPDRLPSTLLTANVDDYDTLTLSYNGEDVGVDSSSCSSRVRASDGSHESQEQGLSSDAPLVEIRRDTTATTSRRATTKKINKSAVRKR